VNSVKRRVLIVEDNQMNRVLERDLLEQAGLEVLEASDAAGGLAIARKEKPDILVLDLRLPDMSGTDLAGILSKDRETSGISVIFVTANIMERDTNALRLLGYREYLAKPIDARTFADEVKRLIYFLELSQT